MKKEREPVEFSIIHQIIGVLLVLMGIFLFFIALEKIIGAEARMISRQDRYNYTAKDYEWTSILWRLRVFILYCIVAFTAGILIIKQKKLGWILLVSTISVEVLTDFFLLQIPNFPDMKIEFDERRLKILFQTILSTFILIIVLLPQFWRPFRLKWFHVLIAVFLFILLAWDNSLIMYQLGFRETLS